MILPLLFLLVPGTLTANNRWSCRSCQKMCSSTASNDSALCKCDADCQVFSDCCGDHTAPSSCAASHLLPLQDGVMLDCISTYLNPNIRVLVGNEAFLMVSTCPDSWNETEGGITAENCTSPNFTTVLPPVTNIVTGMVYRNEYCALCNGVRELVAWQTNLACKQRVYSLLTSQNISEILLSEPDIFQRECQKCAFQIPSIITSGNIAQMRSRGYMNIVPRSCFPKVSRCLPRMLLEIKTQSRLGDDSYAMMKEKCGSGMLDPVSSTRSGTVYRNVDCAVCNGDSVTECITFQQNITNRIPNLCFPRDNEDNILIVGPVLPFTITLSNLGGDMVSITTKSESTSISLDCPEGMAPVGLECRPTQCSEGYSGTGGRCSYVFSTPPNFLSGPNFTIENCSTGIFVYNETDYTYLGNNTIILAEDKSVVVVMDYDEFGRPLICIGNVTFLDCPTSLVPLNESDYTCLGNESILYENERVEVMFYDEQGRPLICSDKTIIKITNTTIRLLAALPGLQELTYIGCSLSVLGSILILITYSLFSERRTLPGLVLMNVCTSILAISLIFIAGRPAIQNYPEKQLCSSLAIVLHFFYLSQFAWLSIFSFEIVRKFFQARKLLIDSNKTKNHLFVTYLCIGWFLPLLVIATSITLNFSVDGLVLYGVDKDGRIAMCWINHFETFIIAFIIPLILSLTCNLIMFFLTTFLICRASRDRSKMQTSNTFILIRVWLAILSTTGLTWIFGFVAILDQVNWVWYPFVIFNSTQGFTMFLAFLFTKNTLRLYRDYFLTRKRKVTVSKNGRTKHVSTLGADREASVGTNISEDTVMKKCRVEAPKI